MHLADQPEARAAVVVGERAVSDSRKTACAAILGQVIADLDRLNHNTEQDFLRIGGQLAGFIQTVNLISSELTALANLVSGEHAQRTSQALASALERSMEMRARTEEDNAVLGSMRQQAGRLKQTLAGFEGTVSTFHALGVLTRIETARLGSAGTDLDNLADEVTLAAGSIQTRVKTALDTGAHLIPPIEGLLRNVSALEEGQAQDLPRLISGALASLASFRDIQTQTHDASVRLGARYGTISDAFKKLIVSIQFHDITRQQVEHVIDALRRLCSQSGQDSGTISGDPGGAAVVLALQSTQLADAGEKFGALVASVAYNLDRIAALVLEMAAESRTLSGVSGDETNSFFLQMEGGCTAILATLSQSATAQAAIRVTSGSLAETIGRMRGPLEEIQAIEIQMRRMAMNARISAVHLGATGNALGVLAGSVQRLASECRERSELLVEALGSMSDAAMHLSRQGGPAPGGERLSHDGCLEGMRTAVQELHSSGEHSFAQIAQIAARCGRLQDDLSATRKSFSAGALFADAVSRARAMLEEIGVKKQSGLPHGDTGALERDLADFARHYTMQAERDVHADVTRAMAGAAPVAGRTEQPGFPPEGGEELGENVEFF